MLATLTGPDVQKNCCLQGPFLFFFFSFLQGPFWSIGQLPHICSITTGPTHGLCPSLLCQAHHKTPCPLDNLKLQVICWLCTAYGLGPKSVVYNLSDHYFPKHRAWLGIVVAPPPPDYSTLQVGHLAVPVVLHRGASGLSHLGSPSQGWQRDSSGIAPGGLWMF
jgi:hypothetical protein